MKPIIKKPEILAKERFTGKVRLPNNISLVKGLKASHESITSALDYLQTGIKLSTATGVMLDAKGEFYDLPRAGMGDDEYRSAMQTMSSGLTSSQQSRPSIGRYIVSVYGIRWLKAGGINSPAGALGAVLNRAPLDRMIYVQCGRDAPDLKLPDSVVSATFSGDIYSTATRPNVKLTDNAPMMPGNTFASVWGGLEYVRTQRAIRVSSGITIRVKSGKSVLTRQQTNEIISQDGVSPKNTLTTRKAIEVTNG
ncbi:hypothetical protein NFK58_12845 [Citrobacter portucalensis]|uniref:hypothetical protein n=1 Tax=Citrobacter portucalensis TaxID=1639133 RepID=UPI00243237A4|nr:hypothetical protein [Citrobacter portucalensis]WFZ22195.1 hypothetical protein NFK58_12845 [Citrobacter portucalensis]